ncbi:hypothetical protein CRD16_03870 [Corynebacterium sp. LK29]|uniref:DUF6912 family protein n=1 Tax=Corynebacterium sp. LK29 TaxID=2044578 RepID=UPI0016522798|nr:hypothetical protein [Corynebacterium sp. LK29]MBC6831606.1 hypothetical protein [Corynebacterium sp. LK29]
MRVYIPATFSMLEALKEDELFHARGGWGFAVTESLRDFFTEGDDEELADVAFDEAARASLRLLDAAEEKFPHRRVVISVDVEAEPQSDMGDAVVKVGGPISLADVAALHIDVKEAENKVEAAIDAVDKTDLGDEDAELTVGDALEIPLAWYDVAELGMVVDFL